jgi:hypothetical protein
MTKFFERLKAIWNYRKLGIWQALMVARIEAEVKAKENLAASKQGLEFKVGDRVRAVDAKRMDGKKGLGTVVDINVKHPELSGLRVLVQFDEIKSPLLMAASQLQFDRD